MKKNLLFIFIFYAGSLFAQQYTLPAKLVDKFLADSLVSKDIIVETKLDKDDFYETKLIYHDKSISFKLKPMTYPNFEAKLKQAIYDVVKENNPDNLRLPETKEIQNDIALVFTQIVTYHNTEEMRPQVASIYLKDNIPVYFGVGNETDKTNATELSDVQVEISFFGGFIEKMQVNGKIGNIPVSFNNKYSMGISSTKNIKQLNNYRLFTNEQFTKDLFKNIVEKNHQDWEKKVKEISKDTADAKTVFETAKAAYTTAKNNVVSKEAALLEARKQSNSAKNIVNIKKIEEAKAEAISDENSKYKSLREAKIKKDAVIQELKKIKESRSNVDWVNDNEEKSKPERRSKEKAKKTVKEDKIATRVKKDTIDIDEAKEEKGTDGGTALSAKNDEESLRIYVSDVIRYVKKVDVNANDISPVPQLVILDKDQKDTKLYREESSKLFEAIVYTDFFGIFDEANPNGIIQTEVNKKFNITTLRKDFADKFIEGWGMFQYFDAHFQFSKIEKNNKFLLPSVHDVIDENGTIIAENYYSPIGLYQYRNFSIGGNLNILFLENQNAKINATLDAGFLFGRSGTKETVDQVEGTFLNNLEIPVEFKVLLLPEKRVSFVISDRLSWFEIFDSKIKLRSVEDNILVGKNSFLNSFNVGVNLDVSSSGKLFLRYKLVHEWDDINNNFSQLQFGYSFYLLQKNGVRKKE
ncbi:hypothetical protein [Flavobacterium sp.]|uniref:hypothetical protein n=1 Tax=Flavobacterium sp. TaxID=239 RepID=UPI003D6A5CC3